MLEQGAFDEFWETPGGARPHQRLLEEYIRSSSPTDLEQLQKLVRQRINEQEVTFNILGVPEGTNRPWQLDSLPLVISSDEWTLLGQGLRQRARLLEAVLRDVYGSLTLLRRRVLPAEIVFLNPRFLRPCRGVVPTSGPHLVLYAVDVGRDTEGRFRVFTDRTAAPTGAGYALENRLVLGRELGDLFRAYPVERLSEFFGKVRRALEKLAAAASAEPRIVLLSAGPKDESSFEHAYLARYLGYELVEGRDLTVRGNAVHLKTLSGLRRVDVILRRVFDEWCDPLELRADSTQGVAGLLSAAQAGTVALANPLGSGFAETPALRCFLPALCRELLGEELLLADVPCHWCGDPEALDHVLSTLDEFVIKPAFSERRGDAIQPSLLTETARERLVERIRARPASYLAERWPTLSTAPYWQGSELLPGQVSLRAFLCRDDDDYDVMPGGLARIDAAPDGLFLSLRGNGVSKDVWIPATGGEHGAPLPAMPDTRVTLRRGGVDLPSRLLDDIYWLGRHVERCDAVARLVRAGFDRLGLEADPAAPHVLITLQRALRELSAAAPSGDEAVDAVRMEAEFMAAVYAQSLTGSLTNTGRQVHDLTLSVRSRLSRDLWHVLRRLSTTLTSGSTHSEDHSLPATLEMLDELLVTLAAVSGTTADNMVRGHVWLFLDMGRRVERGLRTLTLLRTLLPTGASRAHMEALLEVADSLLTYRARYLSALQAAAVVDLLLTDETNPRAVAFQVAELGRHLTELPRLDSPVRSRAERRLIELSAQLLTADVEQACSGDGSGLSKLIEDASTLLWQFSDDVGQTWFSHAAPSRSLTPPAWVDENIEAQ